MDLPLISHPTRGEKTHTYTEDQLTERGDLRLTAHNRAVGNRATRLFGTADEPATYLRAAATLHDFGKATPQFQAYVRPDETLRYPDEETTHARLGALVTWYALGELGAPDRDRLAGTLAVARHHQALPDAARYTAGSLTRAFSEENSVIQSQLDAIDANWPEAATALLELTPLSEPDWGAFYSWASSGEVGAELRSVSARTTLGGYTPSSAALPDELYDRVIRYWSAITLADKTHAMDIPEDWVFDLQTLDRDTIDNYIRELRESPPDNELTARLNDERERARRQAIQGVHEWVSGLDSQIATLTLPTGLGKTFTGLSAAFEARDLLAEDQDSNTARPIIYALPYTSIIEQTRAIFEDPDLWGADPTQSALTVHHYLSETVIHHDEWDTSDTTATDGDGTGELLGEAWRDGTVLTTFVQLFESLTGPTNRQGLKLPALESSIVILDEPQALPKDWWDGIVRLLNIMTAEYDALIIAMTATQPSLVRNLPTISLLDAGQSHETAPCQSCSTAHSYETTLPPVARETYFEKAERVRYTIDETALSRQQGKDEQHVGYDAAAERILDATGDDGSTLAICNTIGSSRALTETLSDRPSIQHLGSEIESVLEQNNVDAINPSESISEIVDEVVARVREDSEHRPLGDPDGQRRQRGDTERTDTYLLTLNSRYRPFDREILIELVDRLSTGTHPLVLVSTQAIEAGVDLSFQTVFRDVAPLDSIVQAAGRCNRSYEWGESGGRVIVWMLADPDEDTPATPETDPPAYYVYERGATDSGIPGHLETIADVLADIPSTDDAGGVAVSRDAVTDYFEKLDRKSLWSGEIREAIDRADARWLSRQSLIGGVQTLDVLVTLTEGDKREVEQISDHFTNGNPAGYDRLQNASGIRVSVPQGVVEDAPQLSRIDKQERNSDGVQVFQFTGSSSLKYDLTKGGLQLTPDSVSSRFTI